MPAVRPPADAEQDPSLAALREISTRLENTRRRRCCRLRSAQLRLAVCLRVRTPTFLTATRECFTGTPSVRENNGRGIIMFQIRPERLFQCNESIWEQLPQIPSVPNYSDWLSIADQKGVRSLSELFGDDRRLT